MPPSAALNNHDTELLPLFHTPPQAMWRFDAETQSFLEANHAAGDLYGYSPEEFRHLPLSDVQDPADAARFVESLKSPGRFVTTWRHRTKSGRIIEVEIVVHEIR